MLSLAVVLVALGSFAFTHVSYSKSSSVVGVSTEKLLSPRLSSGKGCGSDKQLLHVSANESSSRCFPTERGIPCGVPTSKFHRSKGSIFQPEPKAYYELQHRAATNSSGGIIAGSCCGGILFFLAVSYFLWRILRDDNRTHPTPPPPPPPCVC